MYLQIFFNNPQDDKFLPIFQHQRQGLWNQLKNCFVRLNWKMCQRLFLIFPYSREYSYLLQLDKEKRCFNYIEINKKYYIRFYFTQIINTIISRGFFYCFVIRDVLPSAEFKGKIDFLMFTIVIMVIIFLWILFALRSHYIQFCFRCCFPATLWVYKGYNDMPSYV